MSHLRGTYYSCFYFNHSLSFLYSVTTCLFHFEKLIRKQSLALEKAVLSSWGEGSQEARGGTECLSLGWASPSLRVYRSPFQGSRRARSWTSPGKHKPSPSQGIWRGQIVRARGWMCCRNMAEGGDCSVCAPELTAAASRNRSEQNHFVGWNECPQLILAEKGG